MKKFFHILLINIVFLLFFLFIIEFYCVYKAYKTMESDEYTFKLHLKYTIESYMKKDYVNKYDIRPTSIPTTETEKKPLAVMGCSYAYGLFLKNEETLSSRLSQQTGRTVFNLGIRGASPREILYIFRNENITNQFLEGRTDIEYVFYPYISHHRFRLHNQTKAFSQSPCFKRKDDSLVFYEPNRFITNTQLYKKLLEIRYYIIDRESSFDLMLLYLKEINKEMKKRLPNATFVLLLYEDYLEENWSVLEKDGIVVINIEKLVNIDVKNEKYTQSKTDPHPNAKAWEVITPKLVERLEL